MRPFGHLLIWLGFLAGAYFAVVRADAIALAPFLVALAVAVLGVLLVRTSLRRRATHVEKLVTDMATLERSLAAVVADVETLDRDKESLDVYDLHDRIDDTFPDHLTAFVDARESIAHRHGLQAYAEVMSHFAAGERYLNRVWSASTDGYIDEAHEQIGRSRDEFAAALASLRGLGGAVPATASMQNARRDQGT